MNVSSWVKNHKLAAVAGLVGVFFIGFVLLAVVTMFVGGPGLGSMDTQAARGGDGAYATDAGANTGLSFDGLAGSSGSADSSLPPRDDVESGAFVEVQEARFDIDSDDVMGDAAAIRTLAGQHNGYVEESRKHESSLYRTIDLTVRVPDSDFDAFTQQIQDDYDVDSFNVKNYRVSTQRELDELTLLNRTMQDYEEMREQIRDMNNSEKKINLLLELTEKELQVAEKQQHYQRQLSDKQKMGDEATVNIELRERKSVDVWPENLHNRFMNNVKNMLNNVTSIALGTLTQAVVLFFRAVQAVIYLLVIAVPLLAAYRIGRRVYRDYWQNEE